MAAKDITVKNVPLKLSIPLIIESSIIFYLNQFFWKIGCKYKESTIVNLDVKKMEKFLISLES